MGWSRTEDDYTSSRAIIARRPNRRPGLPRVHPRSGIDPEVEQLDEVVATAASGGEDVRRLEVAMDQARNLGLCQGLAGLAQEEDDATQHERPPTASSPAPRRLRHRPDCFAKPCQRDTEENRANQSKGKELRPDGAQVRASTRWTCIAESVGEQSGTTQTNSQPTQRAIRCPRRQQPVATAMHVLAPPIPMAGQRKMRWEKRYRLFFHSVGSCALPSTCQTCGTSLSFR